MSVSVQTLYTLFRTTARRYPERPALWSDGIFTPYGQLEAARARMHEAIRTYSEGKRCSIALISPKSTLAYAAILGILSSGNVYVPIAPGIPATRLEDVLELASVKIILVDISLLSQVKDSLGRKAGDYTIVAIQDAAESTGPECRDSPASLRRPRITTATEIEVDEVLLSSTAYIMFTSGSTGTPKGVPVTHRSVITMLNDLAPILRIESTDRFTHYADLCFDFSIGEIFLCWKAGACLFVPSKLDRIDPLAFVSRHELTVWCSVPSLAMHVQKSRTSNSTLSSLRVSIFCGEALSRDLAEYWQRLSPEAVVYNLYGPTEAAVFSTYFRFLPGESDMPDPIPIGSPLPNVLIRLEAEDCSSEASELLLAGPQVFDGYLIKQKSSVEKRLESSESMYWYQTGDQVRNDNKYGLLFLGRRDRQIKLRGYRVELQDIESSLRQVAGGWAAVVAVKDERHVPIYLTGIVSSSSPGNDELFRYCRDVLPEYMVPKYFLRVDELPLNSNGKTDYNKLTEMVKVSQQLLTGNYKRVNNEQ